MIDLHLPPSMLRSPPQRPVICVYDDAHNAPDAVREILAWEREGRDEPPVVHLDGDEPWTLDAPAPAVGPADLYDANFDFVDGLKRTRWEAHRTAPPEGYLDVWIPGTGPMRMSRALLDAPLADLLAMTRTFVEGSGGDADRAVQAVRVEAIRARLEALRAAQQPRRTRPMREPRYDEVYADGVDWMDGGDG